MEEGLRFGCGALLGVFIGLAVLTRAAAETFGGLWTCLGVSMLICGLLAVRYGDEFFKGFSDWFH
jgi:hypothetical protein